MNFGKVANDLVSEVNFSLPQDGILTASTLSSASDVSDPEFYVGCAKWGRKEWVGLIYPSKTKEADFLDEYVKHFNSIELNAAFYKIPKKEVVQRWYAKTKEHTRGEFLFCPKISQTISHFKRLNGAEEATDQFLASVSEFKEFLGPCFLQLSDNFSPKSFPVLEAYLENLPADMSLFVEVRHSGWFEDNDVSTRYFELLKKFNRGAVITDASGRRDCLHMELTVPEAFIRFVGNGLEHQKSDFARIDAWVDRLETWIGSGLQKVYFFLHQHDEKDTPILADYAIKSFNKRLGASLDELRFLT